jgi:hypothetical protein
MQSGHLATEVRHALGALSTSRGTVKDGLARATHVHVCTCAWAIAQKTHAIRRCAVALVTLVSGSAILVLLYELFVDQFLCGMLGWFGILGHCGVEDLIGVFVSHI